MAENKDFEIDEHGVLVRYLGREAHVTVPNGVREIGFASFSKRDFLESVTLPGSVRTVAHSAFGFCPRLSRVTFSEGVERLEYHAFIGCSALTHVSLPDSVLHIDGSCFEGCSSLSYTERDGAYYLGSTQNPYAALIASEESIEACIIAEGTRLIAEKAFDGRVSLRSLHLPSTLRAVDTMAFYECDKIAELSLPEGLVHIGDWAFEAAPIEVLLLPDSLTYLGEDAFASAPLRVLSLPPSLTYIGKRAFLPHALPKREHEGGLYLGDEAHPYTCLVGVTDKSLCSLSLHADTKILFAGALDGCALLTEVTLPEGVRQIGERAFRACKALRSIAFPSSLRLVDEEAFADCVGLSRIAFSGAPLALESAAFSGCEALTELCLHAVEVGDNVFDGCTGLRHVTVGADVNLYGYDVFTGCEALCSVTLPKDKDVPYAITSLEGEGGIEIKYL